MHILMIIRFLQ